MAPDPAFVALLKHYYDLTEPTMARKTKRNSQPELNTSGKTALYIRVSTIKQAEEGYSLDAQRSRLDGYCRAQGWTVEDKHVYIDAGISGKTTDRPAYRDMLQAVEKDGLGRVVAIKMDRFSRSVRDFLELLDYCENHNCAVVSLGESIDTSTPIGRMMITVIAAVAEMEKDTIKERLMSGRAQKATQGGHAGGAIEFGYSYSGEDNWTINEDQAATVKRIFRLFLRGCTLTRVAAILNKWNLKTARGSRWYPATVRYILSNGAYAGLAQWDGIESAEGKMPPIISVEDYEATQLRLATLKRGNPYGQGR